MASRSPHLKTWRRVTSRCAFTLTEMLFSLALIALVFVAVIGSQYYGIQIHNFVKPKLETAAFARTALGPLVEEVRSAQTLEVGKGTASTFFPVGSTNAQQGSALRIGLAANTNQFIYYFLDPGSSTLWKMGLGTSNAVAVARSVTNEVLFRFENYQGVLATNNQNHTVVDVFLQMRQPAFRRHIQDSFQVRTKITRRAIL